MNSDVSRLHETVPVRVRVALAMRLAELVPVERGFATALTSFASLVWSWVSGGALSAPVLYESFFALHAEFAELAGPEVEREKAALLGAWCALWEVFETAYDAGEVADADLPSEVAEGDADLWEEFREALCAVQGALPAGLKERVHEAATTFAGIAADSETCVSRGEVVSQIG
jgi:hypothetical protein